MITFTSESSERLLLVGFQPILVKQCRDILELYCNLDVAHSMQELESVTNHKQVKCVVYVMDYTNSTHLHNIEFIRETFSDSIFYIVTTSMSVPLLHHALHIHVDDLYLMPLSDRDLKDILGRLIDTSVIIKKETQFEFDKHEENAFNRDDPMQYLFDIIEKDYSKGPSLQDLAHQVHLSPSRLCHMFKDLCGLTYNNYLLCRKLEEAERVLVEQNLSVTSAAYQLGFASPSHFCRVFKEHFHITPAAYANGNREVEYSDTYIRYNRLRSELLPEHLVAQKGLLEERAEQA